MSIWAWYLALPEDWYCIGVQSSGSVGVFLGSHGESGKGRNTKAHTSFFSVDSNKVGPGSSYKWGGNPSRLITCNPRYSVLRPFTGVITPFMAGRGWTQALMASLFHPYLTLPSQRCAPKKTVETWNHLKILNSLKLVAKARWQWPLWHYFPFWGGKAYFQGQSCLFHFTQITN